MVLLSGEKNNCNVKMPKTPRVSKIQKNRKIGTESNVNVCLNDSSNQKTIHSFFNTVPKYHCDDTSRDTPKRIKNVSDSDFYGKCFSQELEKFDDENSQNVSVQDMFIAEDIIAEQTSSKQVIYDVELPGVECTELEKSGLHAGRSSSSKCMNKECSNLVSILNHLFLSFI